MKQRDESGFTVLETMVSISLISMIMISLGAFFVTNSHAVRRQNNTDVAVGVAIDALSRVRSIRGTALPLNRDTASTHAQWLAAPANVATYLADSVETSDPTAPTGAGLTAALPTTAQTVTITGVTYARSWYIGKCWLAPATGVCDVTSTAAKLPMYRIVVAVTWTERGCPASGCSYVTTTLTSYSTDPVFF